MPFYCVWVKTKLGPEIQGKKRQWGSCVLSCGSRASFTVGKKRWNSWHDISFSLLVWLEKGAAFHQRLQTALVLIILKELRSKVDTALCDWKLVCIDSDFKLKRSAWRLRCSTHNCWKKAWKLQRSERWSFIIEAIGCAVWGLCGWVCLFRYRTPNPFMAPLLTLKPFLTKKQLFFHLHQSWIKCLSGVSLWSTQWALSNSWLFCQAFLKKQKNIFSIHLC